MKTTLLVLLLAISIITFGQPYSIGHRQITWIDSSRNNRTVTFEIYYPASTTADNIAIINNGKKFPFVVFGHGFQLTYSDYLWLKDSLVPKGYFLVFPRTEEKLFPSHTDFAKDYAFIVDKFDATKKNNSSWYYRRIKNSYAVGGHSMGGGVSLLSIQYSSKITAVFNFAAAETNPSAISACTGIAIPALVFAGGKDCISPPSSNQLPMYNNIQNVCKTYVQITDARHCQWANNSGLCRLGEFFCSPATASPAATFAITFDLLYPWLNNKLNSNEIAGNKFQKLLTTTAGITYKQECSSGIAANNNDENVNSNKLKIYPSVAVAGAMLNISYPDFTGNVLLKVFDQSGKLIITKSLTQLNNQTIQISSAGFKKGIYFVIVSDNMEYQKSSFMIE